MSSLMKQSDSLSYDLLLRKSDVAGRAKDASDDSTAPSMAGQDWQTCTSRDEEENESQPREEGDVDTLAPTPYSREDREPFRAVPAKANMKLLRNVSIVDNNIADLIKETRELSTEAFDEDCLEEVTKKSGWKLSLLVSDDLSTLCGFIVAKVTRGALSIANIAIRTEFRRHGFGRLIMEELIKSAKQQGDVYEVSLSSLAEAIKFYQRLGFKAYKNLKVDASRTDLVEGQVYMEKKVRPRPRHLR